MLYQNKLSAYLKENNKNMFLFVLLVYHCFIRPAEILKLKIKDVDFEKGIIRISSSISKNNKTSYTTMSNQLMELMQEYKEKDKELYIFSSRMNPGLGSLGRNTVTTRFRIICRKLQLPEDLKLYNFKHTGNTEMIQKGMNIRELQLQNRHSDISITERYLYRLGGNANLAFRDANEL